MDYVTLVESGAVLMDGHAPKGWRYLIDTVNLDMMDMGDCVAGQVFGNWWHAPEVIRRHEAFGGDLDHELDAEILASLRAAWVDYLTRTTPGTP